MAFIATAAAWAASAVAAGATAIGAGAIAGAAGALAGAIVTGACYGAIIGAATAALSGENILKGALKGAVIGGISGGVFSGLGMLSGISSSTSQMASMGLDASGAALPTSTSTSLAAPAATGPEAGLTPRALETGGQVEAGTGLVSQSTTAPTPTPDPAADRSFVDKMLFDKEGSLNAGAGKVLAGGVEGVAKGLMAEEPETQADYLRTVQAMNVSGDFKSRVANIKIPDYWKRINQTANQSPAVQAPTAQVMPQQIAALTAQQQQGGAYAQPV